MSFSDILIPQANSWADLYVNSINVGGGTGSTGTISYATNTTVTNFSGPWAAPISGSLQLSLLSSNTVTLNIPLISGTSVTAVNIVTATAIPVSYRPSTVLSFYISSQNGATAGTYQAGLVSIATDGILSFYPDQIFSNYGTGGTASISNTAITYNIA